MSRETFAKACHRSRATVVGPCGVDASPHASCTLYNTTDMPYRYRYTCTGIPAGIPVRTRVLQVHVDQYCNTGMQWYRYPCMGLDRNNMLNPLSRYFFIVAKIFFIFYQLYFMPFAMYVGQKLPAIQAWNMAIYKPDSPPTKRR